MSQNNHPLRVEMEAKLSKLVDSDKITLEQKQLLMEAMEGESYKEGDSVEIGLILNTEERDLVIQFIDENVEIIGTNDTQVSITKGNQYVQVEKTTKSVKIQSKKGEMSHFFHSHHNNDSIKINVPMNMPLRIKTVSGDIVLKNMKNTLEVKSVSGDIRINDCNSNTEANSMSGDIEVTALHGICTIISKSGDIEIQDSIVSGTIKSYSGDLSIQDSALSDLDSSSFSGDIHIHDTELKGNIHCKTFSGDVNALLLNDAGEFSGSTTSGEHTLTDSQGNTYTLSSNAVKLGQSSLKLFIKSISGDATIQLKAK
ncbi:DUF4097 domain-containing protein [bacterium]|nr:DUF4097 domain-containing protein [bacterium]